MPTRDIIDNRNEKLGDFDDTNVLAGLAREDVQKSKYQIGRSTSGE